MKQQDILEKAAKQYAHNEWRQFYGESFGEEEITQIFMAGAQWQMKQIMNNVIDAAVLVSRNINNNIELIEQLELIDEAEYSKNNVKITVINEK